MKNYTMFLGALAACILFFAPGAFGAPAGSAGPKGAASQATADWQNRWNRLVMEGKKEGKVVLYGEVGPIFKSKVSDAVKKKFGIEVEAVVGKAPEVANKYLTERAANLNIADILITGQTTTLALLKPKKVLISPKPNLLLPEVVDSRVWPQGVLPFLDKDQLVLRLVAGFMTYVTINKELVREGDVTSYADLLNPKWKGKINMLDPSFPGNGGAWVNFLMTAMGREGGEKYLRQLAAQKPMVTRDARMQGETVARGKYAIGTGSTIQVIQDLITAGTPIAWARMKEGGSMLSGAFVAALPDRPAHPAAAAVLLNFLLSREGQQIASEAIGLPPVRRDIPISPALEDSVPKPGDKVYWMDEELLLREKTFYPLTKEIFGIQ